MLREGYGNYLTGKRIEKGLTIKKLSELTNVPERNLLSIEKEDMKSYSIHALRQYLKMVNVFHSEIFTEQTEVFCKK